MIKANKEFPNFVKYMGSKSEIIDFIINGINEIHREGQPICDLFAGSTTLSGALRGQAEVISNDIQQYSAVLSETYLIEYDWSSYPNIDQIIQVVDNRVQGFHAKFKQFKNICTYNEDITLDEFNRIEEKQRALIQFDDFSQFDNYYLFTKYYSGTYWNYNQCVWIDSVKYVADKVSHIKPLYVAIISSLMYAMAYNSQSSGHYAQYRDAKDEKSMNDILIYRKKNIKDYFIRKFSEIKETLNGPSSKYKIMSSDYKECLNSLEEGTLVYADPPYGLVHYSRFYHAIETLVKYDYPNVAYKGRYRDDRHQSPFCISSQVKYAFQELFNLIRERKMDLVLSYSNSNTNTISLIELIVQTYVNLNNIDVEEKRGQAKEFIQKHIEDQFALGEEVDKKIDEIISFMDTYFVEKYAVDLMYRLKIKKASHNHSTMGRKEDKQRNVDEILIIAERIY
ncbi:hypothetical protein P4J23_02235 [Bacillus cereus]|uniref:DNA adenine methylase n=1 Tax=Bacillus cereus TaxID=1396 RepID=UPI00046FF053|nr:DNA adenine methylase [Bacillus cereus]ASI71505.1 hypothetical protein BA203_04825 [Bacillus cereus]MEB9608873.1 hypothetical protein [Bacillus cereus]